MSLENGSRLGPYEIVSPLGVGGMGEVYRARDPRLGRDVAIKLLPDAFAEDPDRLARFEREAKLLASLQHANIAVLHGLEEAGGRRFLVMQCVEGESLAQRLERGPLALMDTLDVGVAIASALEAAHEGGIVHRDLKPGNVMVTPSGDVKVLDFGLAKGGAGTSSGDTALSASPTRTYAATSAGMILGTAAYMSPEQSRGKPVDRRTDIWSFGCVLYECLSGKQAFAGETVSDIVARILQTEPDWDALPAGTPGRLRDLIARCLQKDAKRRLRDIGDARIELEDLVAGRVSSSGAHAAPRRPWLVPAIVALAALAAAAAWFGARATAPRPPAEVTRFMVASPPDQNFPGDGAAIQISPDGRAIAMVALDSAGTSHLWIRTMDSLVPRLVPGSDGATLSFWSPDSRWIAFCSNDRQLLKARAAGGAPEPVCDIKTARGGTWNRDDVILVAPNPSGGIYRVPAGGGDPVLVVRPDSARGENALRFPSFLPDGKRFLYSSLPADSTGKGRVCLGSLDGSPPRVLMHAECGAVYAEPGWLLYTRRGTIVAQRFDAGPARLIGEPIPLGDVPEGSAFGGSPLLSAARNGSIAFVASDRSPTGLVWLDLAGRVVSPPLSPRGFYFTPKLSPDEHHVLMTALATNSQDLYLALADLNRGIVTRMSGESNFAAYPEWSPDGTAFAYMEEMGRQRFVVRSLSDDSRREFLASDPAFKRLYSWSRDGRHLTYGRLDPATKWDVWTFTLDGSEPPRPIVHTAANETGGALSPDGRWVTYGSDASGVYEIYVVPFGAPGLPYQVTNGGGVNSSWTKDGKRLIYVNTSQPEVVMQADILPGAKFALGPARVLGRVPAEVTGADLDNASKRILALMPAERARPQSITVIQDWAAALRKK